MQCKLDRNSRGWTGRAFVKRQTSKGWRKAAKEAVRNGTEAPTRRPTEGWAD
jgi:hypothetical protein